MSEDVDRVVDHYPDQCPGCQVALSTALAAETVSEHDKIDLPVIAPWVERHRRLAVSQERLEARDVADAIEAGDDVLPMRLKLWLHRAFGLARDLETLAVSTLAARRRTLERTLQDILDTPTSCEQARLVQNKFRRAQDQLLTFALWPGQVEANACERDLRPAVVQRKVTNGYRAMWAAQGEADIRTVVDTARLKPGANRFQTILGVVSA